MKVLIQILLWLVFVWFTVEGGLRYMTAASKMQDSPIAIGYIQIAVMALVGLGVMHTLGSMRTKQTDDAPPAPPED
jgi:uncharacterized sodium:solute symporter family permease YidK